MNEAEISANTASRISRIISQVFVLTNSYCVRFCLDFIGVLKNRGGVAYVGHETSADTI